ncbi:MAG: ribonuclease BN [Gammaproteobacteria bacterium CG22_combo_CG10-13_8_21_14_all_40_8]|nr:MAG: ribonuclease BN [Gammaproteobacteria bacterium CG22_combo_CG10-13_8_21_14_all_40_8]
MKDWLAQFKDIFWNSNQLKDKALIWRMSIPCFRTLYAILRDLVTGELSLRAMSLVYTTLLSLIPLLAVSFAVLKAFGVHNQVAPMLQGALAPLGEKSVEITSTILGFVENMKVGLLGSISLIFLFYNVISLMQKIESAFNYTWHVSQSRGIGQRISHYMSTIMIGPILVFSAIGLSATLLNSDLMQTILAIEPFGTLAALLTKLVPSLMIIFAFTFLYTVIPNADVRFGSALVGATSAGILWQLVGYFFASMVVASTKYVTVYSALATPILFMIWLYVGWLILLIGASIANYHQYPEHLMSKNRLLQLSPRQQRLLAFYILDEVQNCFVQGKEGPSTLQMARRLSLPISNLQVVLDMLVSKNLVVLLVEKNLWIPARDLQTIPTLQIVKLIDQWGEKDGIKDSNWPLSSQILEWEKLRQSCEEDAFKTEQLFALSHQHTQTSQ